MDNRLDEAVKKRFEDRRKERSLGKAFFKEEGIREGVIRPMGMLRIFDEKGLVTQSDNMVVVGYRNVLVNLMAGKAEYKVRKIVLSNGLLEPVLYDTNLKTLNDFTPVAVGLSNYVFSKAEVAAPGGEDTVKFIFNMERTEGNGALTSGGVEGGKVYTEAGLYCNTGDSIEDGVLFARVVFNPIVKGPSRRLSFEWIITFT